MSTLKTFLKENEVRVGADFQIGTPIYYQSLLAAYRHYFETFRTVKNTRHFNLDFERTSRKGLAFSYSDLYNTKFCISAIHNFFELLIRGLLLQVVPEEELKEMNFPKKIGKLNKRIHIGEIQRNYAFLTSGLIRRDIMDLNELRNSMLHDASLSINIHALDYLMTQRITPVVLKVIETELNIGVLREFPEHFITHYEINILQEVSSLQFEMEDFQSSNTEDLTYYNLIKLGHLKEMGRACISNTTKVKGNRSVSWYENRYENPHLRNENFALQEKKSKDFYSLEHCPCCGVKSHVVYRKEIEDYFNEGKSFVCWSLCYTCSFGLNDDNRDPYFTDLLPAPIFPRP